MRYERGTIIIRLIMANVAIHVSIVLLSLIPLLVFGDAGNYWAFIKEWFYFPSSFTKIPLRIWTIFTYMFLHDGLLHLAMNMLVLFWFGERLNDLLSSKKVLPIYIWGGIAGALLFAIVFSISPAFKGYTGPLVGASASIMAIVLAAATLNPRGTMNLILIGNVELRYIAAAWVVLNLIFIPGGNPGGAIAHLGGAFMGWFFIYQLRRGVDLGQPINAVIDRITGAHKQQKPAKSKKKTVKKQKGTSSGSFKSKMKVYKGSQRSDYYGNEYGRSFVQKYKDMSQEDCLNTILDQIKRSGYDSLTEDEKVFLDRYR